VAVSEDGISVGCGRKAQRADRLACIIRTTFLILEGIGYPEYSSEKSKRTYSDHAKVGLLILTEYLGKSFEEFTKILPSLKGVIKVSGISGIPDGSTLRKFRKRLNSKILDKVVAYQSRMIVGDSDVTVAVDATGLSTSHASKYYISRLKYFGTEESIVRGYTKVSLAVCVRTKTILAVDTVGSRAADVKRLRHIIEDLASSGISVDHVLADKGYDAEYAHEMIRDLLDAEAIIPARDDGDTPIHRMFGPNRKRMRRELTEGSGKMAAYRKRCLVETVNSMVKRVLGEVLSGRSEETRHSETMFRCIAHNFRIGLELSGSGMLV
jgi:transposase